MTTPSTDPAATLDDLERQVWTTPDGEVTGKQAVELLVWLDIVAGGFATSARIAEQLGLPSASDRRCRRVVERLKDRGMLEYRPVSKTWDITGAALDVCVEAGRRREQGAPVLKVPDGAGRTDPRDETYAGIPAAADFVDPQPFSALKKVAQADPREAILTWSLSNTQIEIDPLVLASHHKHPAPCPSDAFRGCPVCGRTFASRVRWCRGDDVLAHAPTHTRSLR